ADDDADQQPEEARSPSELCGEDGSDERAGAGDGGEVVAEEDPFVGGVVVVAIGEAVGRGDALVIQDHDGGRDEGGVVAVGDGEDDQGGQDEPEGGQAAAPGVAATT